MSKSMREMIENVVQIIVGFDNIAPVELSIGYVDDKGMCHEGLTIKECPPIVVKTLVECGYYLSVNSKGVYVYSTKSYE